jgi:hypothetical protein
VLRIAALPGNQGLIRKARSYGALFVQRYRKLKSYGKSDAVPQLYPEMVRSADRLAVCLDAPGSVR